MALEQFAGDRSSDVSPKEAAKSYGWIFPATPHEPASHGAGGFATHTTSSRFLPSQEAGRNFDRKQLASIRTWLRHPESHSVSLTLNPLRVPRGSLTKTSSLGFKLATESFTFAFGGDANVRPSGPRQTHHPAPKVSGTSFPGRGKFSCSEPPQGSACSSFAGFPSSCGPLLAVLSLPREP